MKPNYDGWKQIQTLQSKEILAELIEAQEDNKAIMLIAGTGIGKTTAIKAFTSKRAKDVHVFTLGDSYNLAALLNEVCQVLGLETYSANSKAVKFRALRSIKDRMVELGKSGQHITLIFDEAENARIPIFKAIKELYDAVIDYSSIVLIGTDQLIEAMNKKAKGQSIPQLKRRFKAGTRYITGIDKARDFKPFFDMYIPKEQEDLKDLLMQLCDNYGELKDYLDPVLRHCTKKNIELTEDVFRLFHKLPKKALRRA